MPPICRPRESKIHRISSNSYRCGELGAHGHRCTFEATTLRRIKDHIASRHRARRYQCTRCPAVLQSARARTAHVIREHGIDRTCARCNTVRLVHEACSARGFICAQCIRSDMRLETRLAEYCRKNASFGKFAIYDTPLSATCSRRPDQLIYGPGNLVIIGELDENAHCDRPDNYHAKREAEIRSDPSMVGKLVIVVHLSMRNALVDLPKLQVDYFRRYVRLVERILTMPPPDRACDFYIGDKPYDINPDVPAILEA